MAGKEASEEDDAAALRQLREEGFLKKESASSRAPSRHPSALDFGEADDPDARPADRPLPGARRLRRTVICRHKNGTETTREIIYTDISR
eukprot:scaffold120865_cov19-Prasinocladus_malaysianus.AAC.1